MKKRTATQKAKQRVKKNKFTTEQIISRVVDDLFGIMGKMEEELSDEDFWFAEYLTLSILAENMIEKGHDVEYIVTEAKENAEKSKLEQQTQENV